MTRYHLEIRVKPRPGLLDPQGKAVQHALDSLGFGAVSEVRIGKVIDLWLDADSEAETIDQGREMCQKLLSNPITEDFSLSVQSVASEPSLPGVAEESA